MSETQEKPTVVDAFEDWMQKQTEYNDAQKKWEKAVVDMASVLTSTKVLVRYWGGSYKDYKYAIVWLDELGNPQYEFIKEAAV